MTPWSARQSRTCATHTAKWRSTRDRAHVEANDALEVLCAVRHAGGAVELPSAELPALRVQRNGGACQRRRRRWIRRRVELERRVWRQRSALAGAGVRKETGRDAAAAGAAPRVARLEAQRDAVRATRVRVHDRGVVAARRKAQVAPTLPAAHLGPGARTAEEHLRVATSTRLLIQSPVSRAWEARVLVFLRKSCCAMPAMFGL